MILFCVISQYTFATEKDGLKETYQLMDSMRGNVPLYERSSYEISKDVFAWYPIAFIQIENYTLLRDDDYHIFLLTKDTETPQNTKNILYDKDAFIVYTVVDKFVEWTWLYMTFSELYQFEKFIPDNCTTYPKHESVRLQVHNRVNDFASVTYSIKPYGFLLVLMTGAAYNFMTNEVYIDGAISKLEFPDVNAYYRLVIPLWLKSDNVLTNEKGGYTTKDME